MQKLSQTQRKQTNPKGVSMMAHTFKPSRGRWISSSLDVCLVYKASSRITRATETFSKRVGKEGNHNVVSTKRHLSTDFTIMSLGFKLKDYRKLSGVFPN